MKTRLTPPFYWIFIQMKRSYTNRIFWRKPRGTRSKMWTSSKCSRGECFSLTIELLKTGSKIWFRQKYSDKIRCPRESQTQVHISNQKLKIWYQINQIKTHNFQINRWLAYYLFHSFTIGSWVCKCWVICGCVISFF